MFLSSRLNQLSFLRLSFFFEVWFSRRMLTWLNPGIHTFHGTESLLNLIFFFKSSVWYLSLPAVGVGTFTYVYTQLILFSFSGLQCQIIVSCCCHHQLYLAWRNSTLDSHAVSCYFIRKGNLSYFYVEIWVPPLTLNFFLFRLEAVMLFLYIILHLVLHSHASHLQFHQSLHQLCWVIYKAPFQSFLSCLAKCWYM